MYFVLIKFEWDLRSKTENVRPLWYPVQLGVFLHTCTVLNYWIVICFHDCFSESTSQFLENAALLATYSWCREMWLLFSKQADAILPADTTLDYGTLFIYIIYCMFLCGHRHWHRITHWETTVELLPIHFLSRSLAPCHVMNSLSAKTVWHKKEGVLLLWCRTEDCEVWDLAMKST